SHGGSPPWLPRLGLALLGAAAIACIVVSVMYFQNATSRVARTPHSTTQNFTAALSHPGAGGGGGNNAAPTPQQDAAAFADAIENGDFEFHQTVTSRYGGRAYLYRVKLPNDREGFFASDRVIPTRSHPDLRHAQELQQDIETDKGRFISEKP